MKTVQYYVCEVCGTEHPTEKAAAACERFHVMPKRIEKKIQKKFWLPHPGAIEMDKYPAQINVEMEDGTVWIYEIGECYRKNAKRLQKCPD